MEKSPVNYIDRDKVSLVETLYVVVLKKKETGGFIKKYKGYSLLRKGVKPVISVNSESNKILLKDSLTDKELDILKKDGLTIEKHDLVIPAEKRSYQDILKDLLPSEDLVPGSFELLGDIAIIFLREKQLEYRYIIGEAIGITHPNIKTVLNKTDKLDNVYRNPVLELIYGVDNRKAIVKESNVKMAFNVSEVYFCSKLSFERSRILNKFKAGDVLIDVTCGIGPFSLRAAKQKNVTVYANDLNPACFKYLQENIKINKLDKLVYPYCMDGREFIKKLSKMSGSGEIKPINHYFLNLPALSVDFLDAFRDVDFDLFKKEPMVHLYCFEELEENEQEIYNKIKIRVNKAVGDDIYSVIEFLEFTSVKNVSLKKAYVYVNFKFNDISKQSKQENGDSTVQYKNKKVKTE